MISGDKKWHIKCTWQNLGGGLWMRLMILWTNTYNSKKTFQMKTCRLELPKSNQTRVKLSSHLVPFFEACYVMKFRGLMLFIAKRASKKNPPKEFQDPAGIRTQELLNSSQTLLALSHLDSWQKSGRQATQAALPRSLRWTPTDSTLSKLDWTGTLAELRNL